MLSYMKRVFCIITTIPRDIKVLGYYNLQIRWRLYRAAKENLSVPKLFTKIAYNKKDNIAFLIDNDRWTFNQVDFVSNQVGNYFSSSGLRKGDVVVLYMKNKVQYVCIWLGLSKIGVIPALINPQIQNESFVQLFQAANCKALICGEDLQDQVLNVREELSDIPIYISGAGDTALKIKDAYHLDFGISSASICTPKEMASVGFKDTFGYLYTSGTTGLPKAAKITHSRFLVLVWGMARMANIYEDDVIYSPLPMYHASGGILAPGLALLLGNTVALRNKLAVSQYWADCVKYRATVGLYIGELCRYLLNTRTSSDKQHQVRMMIGNGLRSELWAPFQSRFGVHFIREFYGSTEGNANIMNTENKPGAVGFISLIFPSVFPLALVRIQNNFLVRNKGLCVPCKPYEIGMLVGMISQDGVADFQGYTDNSATRSAITTDIFKKGDTAFITGDLFYMDYQGYLYFSDRHGDTFRWKGENVSTTQVENDILHVYPNIECVIYGVKIPKNEGRAGMAAILNKHNENLNFKEFLDDLNKLLPPYAVPIFLRLVEKIETADTLKLKKGKLVQEGFDPSVIDDPLYIRDPILNTYVKLTQDKYNQIVKGKVRF